MDYKEAARRIREHNRIHSYRERNAIMITKALDLASDVLEKSRWIPCSERLPDDETRVIAAIDGESREAFFSYDAFIGSNFYRDKSNVPYWMPMPELPEGCDHNA